MLGSEIAISCLCSVQQKKSITIPEYEKNETSIIEKGEQVIYMKTSMKHHLNLT